MVCCDADSGSYLYFGLVNAKFCLTSDSNCATVPLKSLQHPHPSHTVCNQQHHLAPTISEPPVPYSVLPLF